MQRSLTVNRAYCLWQLTSSKEVGIDLVLVFSWVAKQAEEIIWNVFPLHATKTQESMLLHVFLQNHRWVQTARFLYVATLGLFELSFLFPWSGFRYNKHVVWVKNITVWEEMPPADPKYIRNVSRSVQMSTSDETLRYDVIHRDVNALEQTFVTCRLIFIQRTQTNSRLCWAQTINLSSAGGTKSELLDLISGWTSFWQRWLQSDASSRVWIAVSGQQIFVVCCERFPPGLPTELLGFDWAKPKGVVLFLRWCFGSLSCCVTRPLVTVSCWTDAPTLSFVRRLGKVSWIRPLKSLHPTLSRRRYTHDNTLRLPYVFSYQLPHCVDNVSDCRRMNMETT